MYVDYIESPLGVMEFRASEKGITQVIFCGTKENRIKPNVITDACKLQLVEYFNGQRKIFDLPLAPQGTTFQQSVWACLTEIPFGKTLAYCDLAEMLNNQKAVRAVGGANGRNPISIVIPCHRVIGKDGTLTGYAGGLERKLWLLKHENIDVKDSKDNVRNIIDTRQAKTHFLK